MKVKLAFTEKLIGDLHPKIKYKTHYRNLKLYLSLGMKLLRVHRVVAFRQEPWLKPIDFGPTVDELLDIKTDTKKKKKSRKSKRAKKKPERYADIEWDRW
jgi:hypothetical protein